MGAIPILTNTKFGQDVSPSWARFRFKVERRGFLGSGSGGGPVWEGLVLVGEGAVRVGGPQKWRGSGGTNRKKSAPKVGWGPEGPRVGEKVGARPRWPRKMEGPEFRALKSFSIFAFFSLWGFSLGLLVVFLRPGPSNVYVGLGLLCEPPAASPPPHTTSSPTTSEIQLSSFSAEFKV